MAMIPALAGLLLFSASNLHAQRMGSHLSPYNTPYSDSGTGLVGALDAVQVQPAVRPRTMPPAEMISVRDLVVPTKAAKEFQRSMKAFQSGDFHSAAGHLEKAIQIAPDFVQARNNLGAAYIDLREYESAAAQLQKAIELAPNLLEAHHNLGMALLLLRRFPEAEISARRALALAPQTSSARYALGRILAMEGSNTPEAVEILSQAATDLPEARLPLARVLLERGSVDQAIAELQAYLKDPDPDKKEKVEAWLAQLIRESAKRRGPLETPKS